MKEGKYEEKRRILICSVKEKTEKKELGNDKMKICGKGWSKK